MTGFIYIWFDKKKKRYYVGSHWGPEDDGYVCSSTWMLQAYKKRPEDFKRRILERFNEREKINDIEHRWLQMMKPEELKGERYYNFHNYRFGHWSHTAASRIAIGEKISKTNTGMKHSSETKERMSKTRKGRVRSPEWQKKLNESLSGKPRSEETKRKLSLKLKEHYANKRLG
jgi:hypothetical protein